MRRRRGAVVECDVLIVGSGPGGALTAALLAEAGLDVLVVEDGSDLPVESSEPYTLEEMDQKYRSGGLTTTFGDTKVTYIEGRCVGGASEINAALYHRPLGRTLRDWQLKFQIDDFDPDQVWPFFEANEANMEISGRPGGLGPASKKLKAGADALGWSSTEIERFWKYERDEGGGWRDQRQSMSRTFVPRARAAGARLLADTRVTSLVHERGRAVEARAHTARAGGPPRPVTVRFRDAFVCAGAVQTPLLLRRSRLTQNIGESLRLHPMVRVAARFPDAFNDPSWGVPVQQVDEFKPNLTLGCSHSSLPHVALWLAGQVPEKRAKLRTWEHMAVFYVAAVGTGTGTVRPLPLIDEPLVRLDVTDTDLSLMGEGLYRLGQLLFAAGATEIYSPLEGGPVITAPAGLRDLRGGVRHGSVNVTTIHLFSSCPMGEDARACATDSFGKLRGLSNVWLNDASLLPLSPAVNPQGTVMAIARRNARRYLDERAG